MTARLNGRAKIPTPIQPESEGAQASACNQAGHHVYDSAFGGISENAAL